MDVLREREMKDSLERQLVDEQKTRGTREEHFQCGKRKCAKMMKVNDKNCAHTPEGWLRKCEGSRKILQRSV
ncbi:hypothetical protein RUM44_011855 [Polyplax serrata]|uniref:Uncharacterized protein n=1 Tax=Polyplax serrata TaxID=468196 RepID=A0ABR1BDL2_POLSC